MYVLFTRVISKAVYRLIAFLLGHCFTTTSFPLKCIILWEHAAGQLNNNNKMFIALFKNKCCKEI